MSILTRLVLFWRQRRVFFLCLQLQMPAKPATVMPEPEPEPSAPTYADPRPTAPVVRHDDGLASVFHQPAVVDYHQRLRDEVMRHVVHQQREAIFLERLTQLRAGTTAGAGAGAGLMPVNTEQVGAAPPGPGAAKQTVAEAAAGGAITSTIGGATTAVVGSTIPSKSFTPREEIGGSGGSGSQGAQQRENQDVGTRSAAGAAYAAQRAAIGSAVHTLLR
jgi:hypothetical protein